MKQILDTTYTVADYVRTLNMLFFAMFFGLFSFSVIFIIFQVQGKLPNIDFFNHLGLYIAPVIFLILYIISTSIYKRKILKVDKSADLLHKGDVYRSIQIFRMALFEVSVFYVIIGFGMSGNWIYLVMLALGIIIVLSWKPSVLKMIREMDLNNNEASIMQHPHSILYQEESQEEKDSK